MENKGRREWWAVWLVAKERAGSAQWSLKWSMSACLTVRTGWVLHCLSKLPSWELLQLIVWPLGWKTLPLHACFNHVYWYWEVSWKPFIEFTVADLLYLSHSAYEVEYAKGIKKSYLWFFLCICSSCSKWAWAIPECTGWEVMKHPGHVPSPS